MLDKSPLKTLTLEDFLESERHKLSGTLTPVTPETFAKWKAERMDKKAAEEQARLAKEATGRALFEKGDWNISGDEDDDNDDQEDDAWDMEKLRRETEALQEKKEAERMAAYGKGPAVNADNDGPGGAETSANGQANGDDASEEAS